MSKTIRRFTSSSIDTARKMFNAHQIVTEQSQPGGELYSKNVALYGIAIADKRAEYARKRLEKAACDAMVDMDGNPYYNTEK